VDQLQLLLQLRQHWLNRFPVFGIVVAGNKFLAKNGKGGANIKKRLILKIPINATLIYILSDTSSLEIVMC
jgi:hypothetical protein